MIVDADLVVLDTNALVYIGRGKEVKDWMESQWKLLSRPRRCIVSRVVHAEIATFMTANEWGGKRKDFMAALLASVVTVDITAPGIQDAYVELDLASRAHPPGAVKMGKNDLWIAATTKKVKGVLVTCDGDFDHLSTGQIRVEKYDPEAIGNAAKATAGGQTLPGNPPAN